MPSSGSPRSPDAVFGVGLYERARWLRASLDSLVGQTHRNVAFVLVDDCSLDGSAEIAAEYARADPRVRVVRNPQRLGLVHTWRVAFDLAREAYPDTAYFAWGSDHDLWDPDWLAALLKPLDADPRVVLAYPEYLRLDTSPEAARGAAFDTAGVRSPALRLTRAARGMSAGNMVYGLYRIEALDRVGRFPAVISPDRLLLAQLALLGEFRQVPRVLWRRRFVHRVNPSRQRSSFFPGTRAPFHAYVPWWLVHGAILAWRYVVRGVGRPEVGRADAATGTAAYVMRSALGRARKWAGATRPFRIAVHAYLGMRARARKLRI